MSSPQKPDRFSSTWIRVYVAGNMEWLNGEDSRWRPSIELLTGIGAKSPPEVLREIATKLGKVRLVFPTEADFDHGGDIVEGIVEKDIKLVDDSDAVIAVFTKRDQVGTLIEVLHAARQGKDVLIVIAGQLDVEAGELIDGPDALERLQKLKVKELDKGVFCRGDTNLWFLVNYFAERTPSPPFAISLGPPRVRVYATRSASVDEVAEVIEHWLTDIRPSIAIRGHPENASRPPPQKIPSPEDWFSEFTEGFFQASLDANNPVGLHFLKRRIRRRIRESDAEWTELVRTFLANMAWRLGFWQEWERNNRTDIVWYEWDASNPAIEIEHEHVSKTVAGSEVKKILESDATLKVVFTYFDKPDVTEVGIVSVVENVIRAVVRDDPSVQFLLVVGDKKTRSPLFWWGYVWSPKEQKLLPATPDQKAVRCKKCKSMFQPWGDGQEDCIDCEFKEATDFEVKVALGFKPHYPPFAQISEGAQSKGSSVPGGK